MSEPTARPWHWRTNPYAVGPLKGAYISAYIKDVAETSRVADILSRGGVGQEACEANAALIVKAVNSHDKLVEVLHMLVYKGVPSSVAGLVYWGISEEQRDSAIAALEEAGV